MNIKALIAAMDAPKLAKEAEERARLKPKKKRDQDEIPDLVKKAFEKRLTQAQVKQALLQEKWRPPGYISVLELLDLAGTYKFKEWSGKELEILANPPKCLQVPDSLDLKNVGELIFYAFSNDFIKEGIRQPPSISGDNSGVWQDAWLYLHRVGNFNGAKTKEDAIDGWLEEASFIVAENKQYNDVFKKLEQVKKFLRDVLCEGKIKAVKFGGESLEDIPRSYWLDDGSADVLAAQNPSPDFLFEFALTNKFLKKSDFLYGKKSSASNRGRKKGDGTYNDEPFLSEMRTLIVSGEAKSPQDASVIVAKKYEDSKGGPKGQSQNAIIDRLARKYREQEKA